MNTTKPIIKLFLNNNTNIARSPERKHYQSFDELLEEINR